MQASHISTKKNVEYIQLYEKLYSPFFTNFTETEFEGGTLQITLLKL